MRWLKGILRTSLALIIVFFIFRLAASEWAKISTYAFHIDPLQFIFSLALLILGFLMLGVAWTMLLRMLDGKICYGEGSYIYFKTVISRYVPGVIWPYLGRYMLARKKKVPDSVISVSIVMEIVLLIISSAFLSFASLYPLLKNDFLDKNISYLVIAVLCLILLHPKVFGLLMNAVSKVLKERPTKMKIRYLDLLKLISIYLLRFILLGASFVIFASSLFEVTPKNYLILFGVGIFSWLVGYLFFIVPAGIGVKEAVVILLLEGVYPAHVVIILAIASRLWLIIGELMTLGILTLMKRQ